MKLNYGFFVGIFFVVEIGLIVPSIGQSGSSSIPENTNMAVQQQQNNSTGNTTFIDSGLKVKLSVFFESLCPDSRRFFTNELEPNIHDLKDLIQLELVPFGKARIISTERMICQHGANECDGNRIMACIIARNAEVEQTVKTISCLFENDPQSSIEQCVKQFLPDVQPADIENCRQSKESFAMMEEAERKTGRLNYVPHLRINDKASNEIQMDCEQNLKTCICKYYTGKTKDTACDPSKAAGTAVAAPVPEATQ